MLFFVLRQYLHCWVWPTVLVCIYSCKCRHASLRVLALLILSSVGRIPLHPPACGFSCEGKEVCVVCFLEAIPFAYGLVAVGKQPPHPSMHTNTLTEHLLYILKHAASLRSWKENTFFLSAAETLFRSFLSVYVCGCMFVCTCVCACVCMFVHVWCCTMIMTVFTPDNMSKHCLDLVSWNVFVLILTWFSNVCAFLLLNC